MKTAAKVTVHLPAELLKKARRATGRGITDTIRQGLQLVAAGQAYEKLKTYRGKYRFSLSLNALRED